MKSIYEIYQRKTLTALSPLSALVLFYVSPHFAFGSVCVNSVASQCGPYLARRSLCSLLQDFGLSFSKSAVKLGRTLFQALIEAVFAACLVTGWTSSSGLFKDGQPFESVSTEVATGVLILVIP